MGLKKKTKLIKSLALMYHAFRRRYDVVTTQNACLRKLVHFQHSLLPISPRVFGAIFKSRLGREWLSFYWLFIYQLAYSSRLGNSEYWNGKESLYWHLYRQHDVDHASMREIFAHPRVSELLQDPKTVAVEVGIGIAKKFFAFPLDCKVKKYIGVELNSHVTAFLENRTRNPMLSIINSSIAEFVKFHPSFDILLCFGGVLFCLDETEIMGLLQLAVRNRATIVISGEGTTGEEISRSDQTTMYNFNRRLQPLLSRIDLKVDFLEEKLPDGLLRYFMMIPN